ncbi:MAG: 2-amino-4-hydroxy-6-hydroxymethyldihydropteridine diphosphokinase [Candidatus Eisenbacteria bacterium]|nr:2-amino-4-hydroxy-6-hydroxymethyldihydropteridine diphosphokinase [Candidatus Latescibacterota bacterium]MBD3303471.1 2-amino-4-hydroxy-6-hydroxymethyldihydropteridine diphosphokinase [Candidatus Eisenbacteria bacterium]
MTRALIGLGANLGRREEILREAGARLRLLGGEGSFRASHLYESRPWGRGDQPDFLNAVVAIDVADEPESVLERLKRFESELGRIERERWGPREIDLDLLDQGGRVLEGTALTLPHPRIAERAFVLVPLCELDPTYVDPLTGRSAAEMLAALDPDPEEVRLWGRFPEPPERRDAAAGSDLPGD